MLRKFTIVNYRHNRAKVATKSACSLSAQLLDYYACNSIGPWLQFARKAQINEVTTDGDSCSSVLTTTERSFLHAFYFLLENSLLHHSIEVIVKIKVKIHQITSTRLLQQWKHSAIRVFLSDIVVGEKQLAKLNTLTFVGNNTIHNAINKNKYDLNLP